ncbi:MAG TPA: GFA family protein [Myxococcaceae bacterium]|nr:GFA family protein [Myxococcaceae bacterium]
MSNREHRGSCHCGAVRFECAIDWSRGTSRCNCSVCGKSRFWKVVIPSAAFRLLGGEEALVQYRFGRGEIVHHFCRRCGVKPFGTGSHPALGGPFHAVSVACLDDLTPGELAALPVRYEDGRHDRWDLSPAETRHL